MNPELGTVFSIFGTGTAGLLNLSTAIESNGDIAVLDNDGYFAPAIGVSDHLRKAGRVFEHVDVFKRDLAAGEILTGSRSVGSEVLSVN